MLISTLYILEDTKVPRATGWKKEDIKTWLLVNGAPAGDLAGKTILELVELSKGYRKPTEHKVDRILQSTAKQIGVLRTPTKMCELNPIGKFCYLFYI